MACQVYNLNSSSCEICAFTLSGWLADAKFRNYKVFRVGAVLMTCDELFIFDRGNANLENQKHTDVDPFC